MKSIYRTTKECVIRCRKARCIEGIKDTEYAIFLDHKINAYKSRVHELGQILNYATDAVITNVQAIPSEESVIIQLADVLQGLLQVSLIREL